MRILIATTYRGVPGGTETYLRALLPALVARGYSVGLLYLIDTPDGAPRIDDGLDLPTWFGRDSVPDEVFRWRPDVCLLQMTDSAEVDETLVDRLPTVLYAHSFYGTCATGLKCLGGETPCGFKFGAACLPRNYLHGCGMKSPVRLWNHFTKQNRRRRLLPKFRSVLTASRFMADEMVAHGAPSERTAVVPLFPTDAVPDPAPPAFRPNRGKVLFVGRYTEVKGGLLLIEAARLASKTRSLELAFAGTGPNEAAWRVAAERSGLPTTFHQWLERDALISLRREADLLAVPSVWPEPFGLVGIEAACVGLPAVAFDVGGIPDWLSPGETGELAPSPPTPHGLAEALERALGDPEHHHRLRVGAWNASGRFTLERHLQLLEPILERATDDAAVAPMPQALVESSRRRERRLSKGKA